MNSESSEQSHSWQVAQWRAAAWILAAMVIVLLGSCAILTALGWRFYRAERPGAGGLTTARASAAAEKWSPPLGPGESAASRLKRLGHDLASLSLAATNRPDPGKVLAEAQSLAGQGRYEEALQRHIWYHNHALEYDSGQTGVRLSSALSDWIELGRKFPKARQALIEIRDRDEREFTEGRGDFALFLELSCINRNLQSKDDTVAVFKRMLNPNPDLAKQCYPVVEDLLVERREYPLCLGFLPDPQARFNSIREELERRSKMSYAPPQLAGQLQRFSTDRFVTQVRTVVEILVASGRKADAESICSQAQAVMADPRLNLAMRDAETRVANQAPN